MRAVRPAVPSHPVRLALVPPNAPVLTRPTSRASNNFIRASKPLLKEMRSLMHAEHGIGLSAPQVGLTHSLSVVEYSAEGDHSPNLQELPFRALWNPFITASKGRQEVWEGCLSLPDMMGLVVRADDVTVSYLDEEARPSRMRATGFLAALLQHELDHLQGKLYTHRVLSAKHLITREEFRRNFSGSIADLVGSWQQLSAT